MFISVKRSCIGKSHQAWRISQKTYTQPRYYFSFFFREVQTMHLSSAQRRYSISSLVPRVILERDVVSNVVRRQESWNIVDHCCPAIDSYNNHCRKELQHICLGIGIDRYKLCRRKDGVWNLRSFYTDVIALTLGWGRATRLLRIE